MIHRRLAPAKVNLYLHVAAPDGRGYHPLQSLVAFADIGDQVSRGDDPFALTVSGPFSAGLSAGEDNLIVRAVRCFEAQTGMTVRHSLHLQKDLPVASGLGGGSADAGAALHLLREVYAPNLPDDALSAMAESIGADGVMCLWSHPAIATGYGEIVTPVTVPKLPCVLINPGVACPTAQVYGGFDRLGRFDAAPTDFGDHDNLSTFMAALRETSNDLAPAAIALQPLIADVLRTLNDQPQTLLARMSGSGATCFALCSDTEAADALSRRMQALWPAAWVKACTLG